MFTNKKMVTEIYLPRMLSTKVIKIFCFILYLHSFPFVLITISFPITDYLAAVCR